MKNLFLLCLFVWFLPSCENHQSVSEDDLMNEFFESEELTVISDVIDQLDKRVAITVKNIGENVLKQALMVDDTKRFYFLIGLSTNEVNDLDQKFFNAHRKLRKKFPELVNESMTQSKEFSKESAIDNYFSSINEINLAVRNTIPKKQPVKRKWYDGCKKIALAGCTLGCGIGVPTVILAVTCGYACYCGFCEGDRDGVCI